jgi:hypothetical protein
MQKLRTNAKAMPRLPSRNGIHINAAQGVQYSVGMITVDAAGTIWHCVAAGNPGTWVPLYSTIPMQPIRFLDTRDSTGNTGGYVGPQPVGSQLKFTLSGGSIAGPSGTPKPVNLPDTTFGLVFNLRAFAPSGPGTLAAYGGWGAPPGTTNVNFSPAGAPPYAIANMVIVQLVNKQFSIAVAGPAGVTTQVVADLMGSIQ